MEYSEARSHIQCAANILGQPPELGLCAALRVALPGTVDRDQNSSHARNGRVVHEGRSTRPDKTVSHTRCSSRSEGKFSPQIVLQTCFRRYLMRCFCGRRAIWISVSFLSAPVLSWSSRVDASSLPRGNLVGIFRADCCHNHTSFCLSTTRRRHHTHATITRAFCHQTE